MKQQSVRALMMILALTALTLVTCEGGVPESVEGVREPRETSNGRKVCVYTIQDLREGQSWNGAVEKENGVVMWVRGLPADEDGVSVGINPDLEPLLGLCPPLSLFEVVKLNRDGSQSVIDYEGGCRSKSWVHEAKAAFSCERGR